MNRIAGFPKYIRDLYAAQSAFIRLGFDADDTFMGFCDVGNVGKSCFIMQLKTQGKEFTITVAQVPTLTYEEAIAEWRTFAEAALTAPEEELDACWRESFFYGNLLSLVGALRQRGFEVPAVSGLLADAAMHAVEANEGPRPKAKA